jgi:hypothetical protein
MTAGALPLAGLAKSRVQQQEWASSKLLPIRRLSFTERESDWSCYVEAKLFGAWSAPLA